MHDQFVTTGRGLRRESPIMRLYEKAKRLGIWNPSDIDLGVFKISYEHPERSTAHDIQSLA